MASSDWHYTRDREIMVSEQFGWIPHCVPYRERHRNRSRRVNGLYGSSTILPQYVEGEASEMIDRNNSDRRGDPDNGGNLSLLKKRYFRPERPVSMTRYTGITYHGLLPWIVNVRNGNGGPWVDIEPPDPISDVALDKLGASLVNRALPTLPAASLGQTLGELRQGLPRASLATFKRLRGFDRDAASDFLNYEFGWKPLISDIRASIASLREKDAKLYQLYRDNGRPVRRRIDLQPQIEHTTIVCGGRLNESTSNSGFNTWAGTIGLGDGRLDITTTTKVSFSGCFVYHIPLGDDTLSRWSRFQAEADYLLGLSLSPELLWELAPWSWLVDWFTTTGDVISNITRLGDDKLVMRYGYVMKEVTKTYRLTGHYVVPSTTTQFSGDRTVDQTWEFSRTYRRRANPYGFGVTWESLSLRQSAILAALGMTRRPDLPG